MKRRLQGAGLLAGALCCAGLLLAIFASRIMPSVCKVRTRRLVFPAPSPYSAHRILYL